LSAKIRDVDLGFAALLERAANGRAAVTVGVHDDAPAADYAAMSEFNGRLGVRELADQGGGTVADPIREAATSAVMAGSSSPDDAMKQAGEKLAATIRERTVKKSGTLAASITARVAT
jgi:hypothetical protein